MMDIIKSFLDDKNVLDYLYRILITAFGSLGLVYISGRLLELLKTYRSKNTFAVICLYSISIGIYFYSKKPNHNFNYRDAWEIFICGTFAAIFYVTVCWRLFDRIDSFLDRKGLKDKGRKYKS